MELICFAYTFIGGLIILVEKESYSLCISCVGTVTFTYVTCQMNEKLLDKIQEVQEAMYDIPWYHLTVKEQQFLRMAMNINFIDSGYNVLQMHSMSFERFSAIMQAAYSNCLVLKDIVTSFSG